MTAFVAPGAKYRLLLRDASLALVGEIADWTRLRFVPRFNDIGAWALDGVPRQILDPVTNLWAANPIFDLVLPGCGVIIQRRIPPSATWMTVLSGPMDAPVRVFSQGLDGYNLSGPDDNVVLADRVAHPSPVDLNFATQAYDVQTAQIASSAIIHFVDVNAGPGAAHPTLANDRRTTGLTMAADPLVGSVISNQGRLQTLLALIQDIAIAGGDIGFRVVQVGTGRVFSVYAPVDLSTTALFSTDLGNLFAFNYGEKAPNGNYGYVGGSGAGTARTFAEGGDLVSSALWGRRIEFVVDRSDTADATQLADERDAQLDQRQTTTAIDFQPAETTALRWGVDYNVGDKVAVVVDSTVLTNVVREVSVEVTKDGEKVTPTVGNAGARPVRSVSLFQKVRSLDERMRQQERK